MPEISLPDIKLPDVKFRDGRLRDMKLPDIDLREHLPDVDLTRLSLPGPLRDLSMPEVSMPDVSLGDLPTPSLPDLAALRRMRGKVELPDVDLRSLDPRRVDLSGVDPKKLRSMAPFIKPAPKPSSPLPWVIVAAVAGMFAGWWLATSSSTGPMMRSMAAKIRGRIDEIRGGGEWDESEERTEGFWSSEDGWRQTGSQAGGGSFSGDAGQGSGAATWEGSSSSAAIGRADGGTDADQGVGGTGYEQSSGGYGTDAGDREG